eukprot:5365668-Pleurochrysis_carterae.AAC.1
MGFGLEAVLVDKLGELGRIFGCSSEGRSIASGYPLRLPAGAALVGKTSCLPVAACWQPSDVRRHGAGSAYRGYEDDTSPPSCCGHRSGPASLRGLAVVDPAAARVVRVAVAIIGARDATPRGELRAEFHRGLHVCIDETRFVIIHRRREGDALRSTGF